MSIWRRTASGARSARLWNASSPSSVRPSPPSAAVTRRSPPRISHARLIVGFRNRLVHEYPQIDDEAVYSIALHDVPVLRAECGALLGQAGDAD